MMRLAALLGRRDGAAATEIALLFPVVATILLGAVDVANGFAARLEAEQAAQRAIERVLVPGATTPDFAALAAEARTAYGKPVISAVAESWLECNGVRQSTYDMICPAGQPYGRYVSVVLRAEYLPYSRVSGFVGGSGPNGGFVVTGDAVARLQ